MEVPNAQAEHKWLQQMIGEWTYEEEASAGKEAPCMSGVEVVKPIGHFWTLSEGRGKMGESDGVFVVTLGFDPRHGKFTGTFVASMMPYPWFYEGTLEGNKLKLESSGPSFEDPDKTVPYLDVMEVLTPDHRILTSHLKGDDGQWQPFMKLHYHRKS